MIAYFIIFILASLGIAWYSRNVLRDPHTHGFYRFFAFEAILALVLVNLRFWFVQPFTPLHLLSWLCLIASGFLAIHGFYLLRKVGQPEGDFEATTRLVEVGAYHYIRHPLYGSLLWLAVGAYLKNPSLAGTGLLLGALAFLVFTARVEEGENLEHFGQAYVDYMQRTRMFIPYIL
jgi:protein-S-isoprenylcysteine O-methyltransferase Ste14